MNGSASCRCALVSLIVLFPTISCQSGLNPGIPPTLSPTSGSTYTLTDFIAHRKSYDDALEKKDYDTALMYRDMMIGKMLADVEARYKLFANDLANDKATFDTAADIIELAAAGTTAAIGGEATKTALAVGLTAFKGSRLSVDKNFFKEKTITFITSQMDADRAKIKNQILTKMALPVTQYTFDEAYSDTIDFYWAGTVQSALETLADNSGQQASQAAIETKATTDKRIVLLAASASVQARRLALTTQVQKMTAAQALAVLGGLGIPDIANVTDANAKERLVAEIGAAGQDDAKLAKLETEFKKH